MRRTVYLSDAVEREVRLRAGQRGDNESAESMGRAISRNLAALFAAFAQQRIRLGSLFTYEELRFLCGVVAEESYEEGDLDGLSDLGVDTDTFFYSSQKRSEREQLNKAKSADEDWTYFILIDPQELRRKVESLAPFELMALADGLRILLGSGSKRSGVATLFPGVRGPDGPI
jgi:hypothetical protein